MYNRYDETIDTLFGLFNLSERMNFPLTLSLELLWISTMLIGGKVPRIMNDSHLRLGRGL
jgi:hypothetical protein